MNDDNSRPVFFTSPDAVEQAFYEALERGDLDALMRCWSDEDEIICIHPNGPRLVGLEAIRRGWAQVFRNGPVRLRITARQAQYSMMVALHNLVELVQVQTPEGKAEIALFATNVYFKTPGGWRLGLHHASPIPDAAIPEETDAPPPTVLH